MSLIFATYSPGQPHPKKNEFNKSIPLFPGPDIAKTELNVLEYFSNNPFARRPPDIHFDYLNHRGEGAPGKPKKEKAELIYFATLNDPQFKDFELRAYNENVKRDWRDWTGKNYVRHYGPLWDGMGPWR